MMMMRCGRPFVVFATVWAHPCRRREEEEKNYFSNSFFFLECVCLFSFAYIIPRLHHKNEIHHFYQEHQPPPGITNSIYPASIDYYRVWCLGLLSSNHFNLFR
jgi:hypothetical protein